MSAKKAKKKQALLGSIDVAWILDMSPDDVVELARKKELKATKRGKSWMFRQADVLTYKAKKTKKTKKKGGDVATKKKQPLLRSRAVAYLLDMSPDDVIELAKRKELAAKKKGRYWRFRQADVLEYKKKMEKEGR